MEVVKPAICLNGSVTIVLKFDVIRLKSKNIAANLVNNNTSGSLMQDMVKARAIDNKAYNTKVLYPTKLILNYTTMLALMSDAIVVAIAINAKANTSLSQI
ncbi:MAG TPA: hypothetical protein TECP_00622 [Hyphomicrobiaceae bacterium MAG_BT-2024]